MHEFTTLLAKHAYNVEKRLDTLLSHKAQNGEITRPEILINAMRHGVLNGGKRLRPFLVIQSAAIFDIPPEHSLDIGVALECLHCYSLIHDDLPALDNDTLRRGKPTVHVAFDEATAILAGNALLTFAFEIIAHKEAYSFSPKTKIDLITALTQAAGLGGMIGGQMLDLEAEKKPQDESATITLQQMKTAALMRFACQAGAIMGQASKTLTDKLASFGTQIGLAFQLTDDLLDLVSQTKILGKTAGKDQTANKATLVNLYGLDESQKKRNELITKAEELLLPFGAKAIPLKQAAHFIATRKN
ncbi:geranyltranstransferase [Bartonella clarridgeiae 73]|uniref:Probable farnesyl diphosphate synthase n=1 Tax=Bartonella clarridgeiae (strain CCUG 45776 / CIP 104772 / 73) TaxID=696125 RepID=E6YJ93_BARC7|nr:farnesyl diphosphate synthase [Bartonella clarridgeiae]WCR55832.1 MAG: (2E-E6)-farnesyl diphosphate synthase [Bartonella clarridgeiae]CBI76931.1 geranyltranstransferase [Bartonella clarridgeiae 73]